MRVWILIASAALSAGCFAVGAPVPPGRPVRDVHDDADVGATPRMTIEREARPGAPEKVRPVIYPPKVLAAFVPEHLDAERDMKIGAHWVYFKLRDSSWVEEAIDREPAAAGGPLEGEAETVRALVPSAALSRMIVPYRVDAPPAPTDRDAPAPKERSDR